MIRIECTRLDGQEVTSIHPKEDTRQHLDAARGEAARIVECMEESHIDGVVIWSDHAVAGPETEADVRRVLATGDDEHIVVIHHGVRHSSHRHGRSEG